MSASPQSVNGSATAREADLVRRAYDRTSETPEVTIQRDHGSSERTDIHGGRVKFTGSDREDTKITGNWAAEDDEHVRDLIASAIADREARENTRANHRNLNRMLTLVGALVIGLFVTFVLTHNGIPGIVTLPHWAAGLAPYSFVITVTLDAGLALYGLIKHY